MKNRLTVIEKWYGNHLVQAGVFAFGHARPHPLWEVEEKVDVANGDKAISHNVPPQAPSEVTIKSDGSVDCQLSTTDVCQTLGLKGTGIGQQVWVRPGYDVLLGNRLLPNGSNLTVTVSKISIVALRPPQADISYLTTCSTLITSLLEHPTCVAEHILEIRHLFEDPRDKCFISGARHL